MKSFGSQLKKANRLSRASTGRRLILLVPIKLRVLELTPVACSITSYVQGLPVCRSLRAISSLSANFTAIPPNVSLLSFYQKIKPCQRCIFVLPGISLLYWLTYFLDCGKITLSSSINRAARLLVATKAALTRANLSGGQQWLTRIYHQLNHLSNFLPWIQSSTFRAPNPTKKPNRKSQITALNPALPAAAGWMSPRIITPVWNAVTK
jgi:hypothetical protein